MKFEAGPHTVCSRFHAQFAASLACICSHSLTHNLQPVWYAFSASSARSLRPVLTLLCFLLSEQPEILYYVAKNDEQNLTGFDDEEVDYDMGSEDEGKEKAEAEGKEEGEKKGGSEGDEESEGKEKAEAEGEEEGKKKGESEGDEESEGEEETESESQTERSDEEWGEEGEEAEEEEAESGAEEGSEEEGEEADDDKEFRSPPVRRRTFVAAAPSGMPEPLFGGLSPSDRHLLETPTAAGAVSAEAEPLNPSPAEAEATDAAFAAKAAGAARAAAPAAAAQTRKLPSGYEECEAADVEELDVLSVKFSRAAGKGGGTRSFFVGEVAPSRAQRLTHTVYYYCRVNG